MIKNIGDFSTPAAREFQIIEDYLIDLASSQTPELVIREFSSLFVQAKSEKPEISRALNKVLISLSGQQFDRLFSHYFYCILDCWVSHPESLQSIPQLLEILEIADRASSYDRRRKQLIKSIKDYQKSLAYIELKTTISILKPDIIDSLSKPESIVTDGLENNKALNSIVNSYLPRYTFLYEYIIPQEFEKLQNYLLLLQKQRRQDFEIKLSRHIIYRFRLKQVARMKLLSKGSGKVITKIENPSLLSEKAFRVALKQYISKIDGERTLLEKTQYFIAQNKIRNSYQVFKQDLAKFLTQNIESRNSHYNFQIELDRKLKTIFTNSESKPLNNTLILQTCRQLFSFLLIGSNSSNFSQEFVNLITNLGTAQVTLILVKLTLICPEAKPDLEKKLYSIVNYYQFHSIKDVLWLVKTLEHLLIAFGIYFGKIDVSIAR